MGYKFVLSISLVVYYMKGQASLLGAVLWKPNEECFPLRDLAKKCINNSSTAQQSVYLSAVDVCACEYASAMQEVKHTNEAIYCMFRNVHISQAARGRGKD